MIAIVIDILPMRTAEYTTAQHRQETLLIKELVVRTEIGTIKASIFGEQARQAESMNLQLGDVILANFTITARKSSSKEGTSQYFNDVSMSIVEKMT